MPSSPVRLYYFSGRGRAEVLRLILAAAKVDYDNVRFSIKEWPEYKKLSPYGTFPLLEHHGFFLGGTLAIARFLAKRAGMAGDSPEEEATADMVAEQCQEYYDKVMDIHMGVQGEENKRAAAKKILEGFLPRFLEKTDAVLAANGTGFFAGSRLSYADIIVSEYLAGLVDPHDPYITHWCPFPEERLKALDPYPGLRSHIERVQAVPEIRAWLDKRPKAQDEEL